MSSDPGPVELKIRIEGLVSYGNKPLEISYKIDSKSKFNLSQVLGDFNLKLAGNDDRRDIIFELSTFEDDPELQISENDNNEPDILKTKNPPFITDSNDFKISWESDRYIIWNQGKCVFEMFQNKKYLIIYKKRTLIYQRSDLLSEIDIKPESRLNIYVENQITSKITIFKFLKKFLEFISSGEFKDEIVAVNVDNNYVEISLEDLLKGVLRRKDAMNSNLKFMNYMAFRISKSRKNPLPNDEALLLSFDAILANLGVSEKERLKSYINMINRIKKESEDYFYTPFVNVCQSSGSGKTKIATELMFEVPSFYTVLREEVVINEGTEKAQSGYPYMSFISKLFLKIDVSGLTDDNSNLQSEASASIVGRYLLLLKALLSDYYYALNSEIKKKDLKTALRTIYDKIMKGEFVGEDLKLYEDNSTFAGIYIDPNTFKFKKNAVRNGTIPFLSMSNVIETCRKLLKKIDSIRYEGSSSSQRPASSLVDLKTFPFMFILDEASLLAVDVKKSGVNLFRLFRRAVNRLGRDVNFVVVTLGTNSDVLDLNPDLSYDSFREFGGGRVFPPFLLSRNWDIFVDYEELKKYSFGYNDMLLGRMIIFWFSLGRPVWSSTSLSRLIGFAKIKICNNSLNSGEAYLAFWMVRVGLLVNPAHVITQYLVKSLMATLLYVSSDRKNMRVCYPSEPALALAIRPILMDNENIESYYASLEKFINARAIDVGRFAEIISGDICLLAIASARNKKKACTWEYNEKKLPNVCKANGFILEISSFHAEESKKKVDKLKANVTDKSIKEIFNEHYIILEVTQFILSLYDVDKKKYIDEQKKQIIMDRIERFVPELMKTAHLNMTHYTQVLIKFPFDTLKNGLNIDLETTEIPAADSKYDKKCNQITAEVLQSMIIRGSGIMLAPSTFGLDHVIPVCLKPADSSSESRSEYSFIGVQVKRGSDTNIRTIVAKGAVSNHYVRCGKHGEKCPENYCKFRIPDDQFKRILENGFMLVHSMEDDLIDPNETDLNKVIPKLTEAFKKVKIDAGNYTITCETSLPAAEPFCQELKALKTQKKERRITDIYFNQRKIEIENQLKNIVKDLCPPEFLQNIDKFEFDEYMASPYKNCRFVPDVYFAVTISSDLSAHCMVKKRADNIVEKIVAIYSKGIEAFSSVLPDEARNTARRIIFEDHSIFDEIPVNPKGKERPSVKYTELINSVVSRNNCSSIPIANNLIRSKYEIPLIPDIEADYGNINNYNMYNYL